MISMTDCIFCKILAGKIPGTFIYRDAEVAAFMDVQPVNPGHVLVVPVDHAAYLADLNEETAAALMRVGQRVAAALRRTNIKCEGVNLFLADGEAAMQEVFHVHLHVFPRFRGDGFGLQFGPNYGTPTLRTELESVGAQLRTFLPVT